MGTRVTTPRLRSCVSLALLGALAACAVGPDFQPPAPPAANGYGREQAPEALTAAQSGDEAAQRFVTGLDIPAQWWTLFKSEPLSAIVADALKANPNMAAAQAALRQARELYMAQRAAYLPVVQGEFAATRSQYPTGTLTAPSTAPGSVYSLYTAQLALSYAPDVFGGTRRAVEAARANVDVNRFELEAAYVSLSSNVVVTVIQEGSVRGQISAAQRLLELQHQLTETVRQQRTLGTASELDLLTQQAAEAQTAELLPPLEKQLGQTRDALTALLGRLPDHEPDATFRLEDLTLPTEIPISLPSRLVAQRPDVRQAEANLHVASAQVGVALANMLPQFSIDADLGSAALKLSKLFSPYTGFWDFGASLTQTLFDAGALRHRHRAAEAALDQAGAQYRAAVILACQNVADTLRALRADADALRAAAEADRAAKASFEAAHRQLELGTVSLVNVLTAEQTYQQAELAVVQARANRYSDTAALYQALGGGWWNRPENRPDEQPRTAGR